MDPSLMDIDLESLTYSACLNNLEPGADYVFRATSAKDKADGKTATEIAALCASDNYGTDEVKAAGCTILVNGLTKAAAKLG